MNKETREKLHQYGTTLHSLRTEKKAVDTVDKDRQFKMNSEIDSIESSIRNQRPVLSTKSENAGNKLLAQYNSHFGQYLRKGLEAPLAETINQMNANGVTINGVAPTLDSNGASAMPDMNQMIFDRLSQGSVIRQFARVITVSRDTLDIASYANEIEATWGDDKTVANETDAFVRKLIRINELTAQPKVTQKMVDDAEIDIESWVAELLSDIFLTKEEEAFLNGDGVNKPKGILSYASGTGSNQIERVANGSLTDVTLDGLLALHSSLHNRYEREGENVFITSKQVVSKIRTLKDSSGQFIWTPGVLMNKQDLLFGVPLYATSSMPSLSAHSDAVIYANLRKGYQIADRIDIKIQRDPYSSKPFIIYFATKKTGGDVIDCNAIKVLNMSI